MPSRHFQCASIVRSRGGTGVSSRGSAMPLSTTAGLGEFPKLRNGMLRMPLS
jgi:hypothetical protein